MTGSVRIGRYALEVGTLAESYAVFEPDREERNLRDLRDALAEETDELSKSVAVLEEVQEHAQTVTAKIERSHELFMAAAEGRLLDADPLVAEVDSLLGLAERLDRDGRFEEELRLLRALHGLLALTRRWLDLIRGLHRGLSAAQEAGDLDAQAWVRHELGSINLCADKPEAAAEQLGQALRLQQRLGQATGTCATRHNLDSAKRDVASRPASKPWSRRRLPRLAVVASALTLVAVGTGMALAWGEDSSSTTTSTAAPTTTSITTGTTETTETTTTPTTAPTTTGTSEPTDTTTTSTTETTVPLDATAPAVTFDTPANGSVVRTRTQDISGTAGVEQGDVAEVLVTIVAIDENGIAIVNERGAPLDSSLSAQVVDGEWSVTETVVLRDGSYKATATQRDDAGNVGESAVTFTVQTGGVD
jgi:hypothetical protein